MTYIVSKSSWFHAPASGRGTSVIALHGSASTSAQWRSLIGWLGGHYRIITPDLPGYGGSKHVDGNDVPTLEEIANAVFSITEGCGEPVHLVGHSFGGAVALKIASMFPGMVRSLTLIEPAAFNAIWTDTGMSAASTNEFVGAVRSSQEAMDMGDSDGAMRHFIDYWVGAGAWDRTSPSMQQKLAGKTGQIHKDFAALAMDQFTNWDADGVVCPVLCITGTETAREMASIVAALKAKIPFMRCEEIEGAGHMVSMTDPHVVDPMIGDFLAQVDRGWQDEGAATSLAA
ncbi:MAG: alpha/beta fold hydrolase [Paracoccaceae bacterium]